MKSLIVLQMSIQIEICQQSELIDYYLVEYNTLKKVIY